MFCSCPDSLRRVSRCSCGRESCSAGNAAGSQPESPQSTPEEQQQVGDQFPAITDPDFYFDGEVNSVCLQFFNLSLLVLNTVSLAAG